MWCTHAKGSYSMVRRHKVLIYGTMTRFDFYDENKAWKQVRSQTPKITYHMISFILNIQNGKPTQTKRLTVSGDGVRVMMGNNCLMFPLGTMKCFGCQ